MENKCYIAGKISGLPIKQAKILFDIAQVEVASMDLEPVSPIDLPHNHGGTWEEYMREDLTELLKCKHLYALSNWKHSVGARLEVSLAMTLGINVIFQPIREIVKYDSITTN